MSNKLTDFDSQDDDFLSAAIPQLREEAETADPKKRKVLQKIINYIKDLLTARGRTI